MSFSYPPIPATFFVPVGGSGALPESARNPTLMAFPSDGSPLAISNALELPSAYGNGTISVVLAIAASSADTGNFGFNVQWRRQKAGDSITRAFASAQSATQARGATAANLEFLTVSFTSAQIDSTAAGDPFVLQIGRDNTVGSNAAGNAWLEFVTISEA
jgi:hypothetical protein